MAWEIELRDGILFIEGEVSGHNVDDFCQQIRPYFPPTKGFDLLDFDIEDGVAMAALITFLRQVVPVEIHHAPQMLAHTIYKIGMLDTGSIQLIRPRYDEN